MELFEKAKELLSVFNKATLETFEVFSIEIKEVPKSPVLGSGGGAIITLLEESKYALIKEGKEIFRGTKKEVEEFAEKLKTMSNEAAEKYLDEIVERRKLDDYINNLGYKFRELGLKFTHTIKKAFDGSLDISMFLVDKEGNKLFQGYSNVSNGILENVFEVSIQKNDVSTAMYKFLDKVGFDSVIGSYYGNSTLNVNYDEFMKVYDKVLDNRIDAAFATPAGKALNKALDNKFVPYVTKIDEINKKVIVIWKKKI